MGKSFRIELILFFTLVLLTIGITYYTPSIVVSFWAIFLLIFYTRSNNEPFWLAFFFVLSDGFIDFFGSYEVSITILPGLPAIEIVQFYVLITIIKAFRVPHRYSLFFKGYLQLFLFYVVFLIVWGFALDMPKGINEIFRVFKLSLPLLLFYSIPKLIYTEEHYAQVFKYLFPVIILAFASQIFTLIFQATPAEFIGAKDIGRYTIIYAERDKLSRLYLNPQLSYISFFVSLFYLALNTKFFNRVYLSIVLFSVYGMAFISATRGLIIALTTILLLSMLFSGTIRGKLRGFLPVGVLLVLLALGHPILGKQIRGAWDRIYTVVEMAEGDEEALATEQRTTLRGPRVMAKWRESPVFGWGFSAAYFKYQDGHVGNQNLLLHAGLVGYFLFIGFLIFINLKLLSKGGNFLVFMAIFIGWFFLHSTSSQHFMLSISPSRAIMQALFFSFMGFQYYLFQIKSNKSQNI